MKPNYKKVFSHYLPKLSNQDLNELQELISIEIHSRNIKEIELK